MVHIRKGKTRGCKRAGLVLGRFNNHVRFEWMKSEKADRFLQLF